MKNVPNIISFIRIILSVVLIFLFSNPELFLIIYLLAGLTDFLDGYIARRYNAQSDFGTKLDSIADFFFFSILTAYLITTYYEVFTNHYILISVAIILRLVGVLCGLFKYKKLVFIHTLANKLSGLLLFLLPVLLLLKGNLMVPFLTIIILAASEEIAILLTSTPLNLDLNKKSFFTKPSINNEAGL